MKRGSIIQYNELNILFMGGANSIDKNYRTIGIDWFPEEIINDKEIYNIKNDIKIDVVLSHTCPVEFLFDIGEELNFNVSEINDPSCKALSYILNKHKPKEWYFSHWHIFKQGNNNDCLWYCLNQIPQHGYWKLFNNLI